jgi:FAD/FMN-containing dehydrogenase
VSLNRRRLLKLGVTAGVIAGLTPLARPLSHLAYTALNDEDTRTPLPAGHIDDASRLNLTAVADIWNAPATLEASEQALRELLAQANAANLPVAAAGTRHTMGGHSIIAQGIAVNMLPLNHMSLEPDGLLRVGAGACWAEVVPFLERHGLSVAVMQSNNTFSVGGSLSANVHGWQHNRPPIAGSVAWLRLMLADGTVRICSREQHRELFSLALGGYGLVGVILEAGLQVVPNQCYRPAPIIFPAEEYAAHYAALVDARPDAGMAYGRLNVAPDAFLREGILTAFYAEPDGALPALTEPGLVGLRRTVFRGSVGSSYGKNLRWELEKQFAARSAEQLVSRNQLLNEGVAVYGNRDGQRTEILHEYFVPREQLAPFIEQMRMIVPRHRADLLNVTIRNVYADTDSLMRYADQELFGLVLLFNQGRSREDEADMSALARALIDAVLDLGGRHYLPYRLHATREQLVRAYPQAPTFFARKRFYDPRAIFQNGFSQTYSQVL